MSNTRDLRAKIANIGKTRKITQAMEHIAFARLARARKRAEAIRPYGRNARDMVKRLVRVSGEYTPPLMRARAPARRIGLIMVTTDRGLCGSLNSRLLQLGLHHIQSWHQAGAEVSATVIGTRGIATLRRAGITLAAQAPAGSDFEPTDALLGAISVPLAQFIQGEIDELYVATNRFVNTLVCEPFVRRLLPLDAAFADADAAPPPADARASADATPAPAEGIAARARAVDYVYEPDIETVVDALLQRFVETSLYQAMAENAACEQASRMTAMKAATENADRRIEELTLQYQKERQEAITRELVEIVAGASATDER